MLRFLRIRSLAVIEAVEVEFEPGFNVLTGETGTGKSILVEAVGLLLGGRASGELVRTGEPQASIEAIFDDPGESGGEILVRREVTSHGRSRAFVNGALATAASLRDLSARLVELHGQHEHQALLDPLAHLSALDAYARTGGLTAQVAAAWAEVRTAREQLERSHMDAREKAARLDLIAFQLREIECATLGAGEDEALAAMRQVLASAERVQRLCEESYAALYDDEGAVLASLGAVWRRVGELAAIDPQFSEYLDARDGIKSQLEDLAAFLRRYADAVDASPGRLQEIEDRLALLERLKRKYGPTLDEVIARGKSLACERDLLTGVGERAEDLQQHLRAAEARYLDLARNLSRRRRTAAAEFARGVECLLGDLAMRQTRFEVRFEPGEPPPPEWSERGIDRAEFYISPNPGEELRPLARIVSGGELSRVMLALRTLQGSAHGSRTATMIFDEVDAGIGGRVADVVGQRLQELGERHQVLCITHLPQIAARAATHFRIQKTVRGARTVTSVERLTDAARVDEIGRMIGGAVLTDAVRMTARDLIEDGRAARRRSDHAGERRKRKAKA